MSKSCWCMVAVFALVFVAGAEGMTTQAFLQQALVGVAQSEQGETGQTQATYYWLDPSVTKELIVVSSNPQVGPDTRVGLRNIDLKQMVVMDMRGMIDVTKKPQAYAVDAIQKAGLKVKKVTFDYSDEVPAGCVIEQYPPEGTPVRPLSDVNLVVAQTKVAVQPFPIERGINGEAVGTGQLIVHRLFDVEFRTPIYNVPIFAIADKGLRHATVQARGQSIAERLHMAWGILDEGGVLETAPDTWIMPDDDERWRIRGIYAPDYEFPTSFPAIFVRNPRFGSTPLRIMTVYPEDARLFGQPADENGSPAVFTPDELAEYLVALIQAHYVTLAKRSTQLKDYEGLDICRTREGLIFKEICLRALEETRIMSTSPETSIEAMRSALGRVALSQRHRLLTLAFNAPRDWRLRVSK